MDASAPHPPHHPLHDPDSEAAADDALLADLTADQRRAVLHTRGPLLVLAGPGSGKTRVITRRIAHLVASGVRPWQILALTFTNKAAGEMRHRVAQLLGEHAAERGLTVTTFHSLCVRLLRKYAELSGLADKGLLKPGFTIYDDDDQTRLIKSTLAALDLSSANWPARSVLSAISAAKNELKDAEAYRALAGDFYARTVARIYAAYEHGLRQANAADFDDLLMLTARMLRESPQVRAEVQHRWRYLLVDEYQDTNRAQFVIASLIAGDGPAKPTTDDPGPNICVVGDPDQSIYGWRGADISNILQFEEQYPGAAVIALGENFRSRATILAAADRLIRRNTRRKNKPLTPTRAGGSPVEIVLARDEHHEAALVLDWLRHILQSPAGRDRSWKDCAVFYRTNALSRVIEDTLRTAGVPYVMVRGTAFYQREEVRNALAYLRLVANPDDAVSLERIINTPARGISAATWDKITTHCAATGATPIEALRQAAAGAPVAGITPRAAGAIAEFLKQLNAWSPAGAPDEDALLAPHEERSLADLVERIVRESGLEKMYATEPERAENLAELVSSARDFEQERAQSLADEAIAPPDDDNPLPPADPASLPVLLAAYLERVALVADTDAIDPASGAVTLMTLHAAKGLEFPFVAIIGLEEGVLPHMRAQTSDSDLEEERRLAFVGVTRAMDHLLITSARFRTIRGLSERTIPSRFLDELAGDGVSLSDQAGFGDPDHDPEMDRFLRPGAQRAGTGSGSGLGARPGSGSGLSPAPRPSASVPFPPGSVVRHPQFGRGIVQQATGGSNARVQIKFDHVGVKTLVLEYARLQRIT
ncbi:MAG: UvrD-helicase domain-containing protein [Phycisphaeraceae bacterium]|nr:UvrD-helicase domain-containing protein [Phycisphaeraceae bacterium]